MANIESYYTKPVNESEIYSKLSKNSPELFSPENLYRSIRNKGKRSQSPSKTSDTETKLHKGPLKLVSVSEEGKFEVCEEGARFLRSLKGNVGIVGIAGPARCGKSFLLNLLASELGSGFQVGNLTKACTEGIWVWGEPIVTPNMNIILLDSEGTKSLEKSETHDAKLFALMVLVCSVLMYNSKGVIDEQALNQLSLATHISEMISVGIENEDPESQLAELAPKFIWVLRDFHLALVDEESNPVTSKDYMENILNMKTHFGRNPEKMKSVRENLLKIFKNRDCIYLPRPADTEEHLCSLSSQDTSTLRSKFVKQFEVLRKSALKNCAPKRIQGAEVEGTHVADLLSQITKAINMGVVPCIQNTWKKIIENQYEELLDKCRKKYSKARKFEILNLPYEEGELLFKLQAAKDNALSVFREVQIKDEALEEHCKEEFEVIYNEDVKYILEANYEASEGFNTSVAERVFKKVIVKLSNCEYGDDFASFMKDWTKAMERYEKKAQGPAKFSVINEFSKLHQHSAFSRFFENIVDEYEKELGSVRKEQNKFEKRLKEREKAVVTKEKEYKTLEEKLNQFESETGITRRESEDIISFLERVRTQVTYKTVRTTHSKKEGCKCSVF